MYKRQGDNQYTKIEASGGLALYAGDNHIDLWSDSGGSRRVRFRAQASDDSFDAGSYLEIYPSSVDADGNGVANIKATSGDLGLYTEGDNNLILNSHHALNMFVDDEFQIYNAADGRARMMIRSGTTAALEFDSSNNFDFKNGSTVHTTIDSSGNFTVGGNISLSEAKAIYFDSTDTSITTNTENPEDLFISADQDLFLRPDNDVLIQAGTTSYAIFDGANQRVGIGNTSPSVALDVTGAFAVSSDATIGGNLVINSVISNSSGVIELNAADNIKLDSHTGLIAFEDQGDEFFRVQQSGSSTILQNKQNGGDIIIRQFDGKTNLRISDSNFVGIGGNDAAQGVLRFYEDTDNGANYINLQAPAAITSNVTFTLPDGDGSDGQFLKTDGNGNLSFASASSGGIALTDLSVGSEGSASGNGAISYNNSSGVFTYTPPAVGDGGFTQNNFTDALKSKLDAIEASADVTDATNVAAAGALMDSEVTNLSEVKAFDSSDYATAAQGTLATNAMPKAGGTFTGDITLANGEDILAATAGGSDLGSTSVEWGNIYMGDGKGLYFGEDQDFSLTYDVGSGSLQFNTRSDLEGGAIRLYFFADAGDDATDKWLWQWADGGTFTMSSITSGGYTDKFTITQAGNASIAGTLDVKSDITGTLATASQTNITGVGTITTGTWNGSVIASAYLDSDTAHLSGTQTFNGAKTFSGGVTLSGTTTHSGVLDITNTTDSSDATGDTGALRVEGGASIAKKLYVGTDLDVDGTANLDVVDIDGAVDMASTLSMGDNIDMFGNNLLRCGKITNNGVHLDSTSDIKLDTNNDKIRIQDNGSDIGYIHPGGTQNLNGGSVTTGAALFLQADVNLTGRTGAIALYDKDNTNLVGFKAPDNVTASNVLYVLPAADGSNGQHLTTDGSGNLSWASSSGGGGGGSPAGSDGNVQFNDNGSFGGEADFTWNSSTGLLKLKHDAAQSQIELESTVATASSGPRMTFYRASPTPADNDTLGRLIFKGNTNDGGNTNQVGGSAVYADIIGKANTAIEGQSDGQLIFRCTVNGTDNDEIMKVGANSSSGREVIPGDDNETNLGNSSDGWKGVYARTYYGYDSSTSSYLAGVSESPTVMYNMGSDQLFITTDGGVVTDLRSVSTSDENLKENITANTTGLSFINQLTPKNFTWKQSYADHNKMKENPERIGWIAQDVEKISS